MDTVYLSRVLLDARHAEVAVMLGNSHLLHSRLIEAFPKIPDTNPRQVYRLLFRVEELEKPHYGVRLLVQSRARPDWSIFPEEALLPAPDEKGNPSTNDRLASIYDQLAPDRPYRFRLLASPTRAAIVRGPDGRPEGRGVRVPLMDEIGQLRWLQRKARAHGFQLEGDTGDVLTAQARVTATHAMRGWQPRRRIALTHRSALFEGVLRITDLPRFQEMLVEGVGTARAYGHGLMSLSSRL